MFILWAESEELWDILGDLSIISRIMRVISPILLSRDVRRSSMDGIASIASALVNILCCDRSENSGNLQSSLRVAYTLVSLQNMNSCHLVTVSSASVWRIEQKNGEEAKRLTAKKYSDDMHDSGDPSHTWS